MSKSDTEHRYRLRSTKYTKPGLSLYYRYEQTHWRYWVREGPRLVMTGDPYPTKESLLRDMSLIAGNWGFDTAATGKSTYQRVLPRDLFNEAKLLKCLGQLSLLVYEGRLPLLLQHDTEFSQGFLVAQDRSSGDIFVSNLTVTQPRGES